MYVPPERLRHIPKDSSTPTRLSKYETGHESPYGCEAPRLTNGGEIVHSSDIL
jgi:hypothetical protein